VMAAPSDGAALPDAAAAGDLSSQARAIFDGYESARQSFMQEWQKATTDAEREKIAKAKMPDRGIYAHRALDLARSHPDDPGAVDAAAVALQLAASTDIKLKTETLDLLEAQHLNDERLGQTFQWLLDWPSKKTEAFLQDVSQKSTNRNVRGQALMALAGYFRQKSRWGERFKQQPDMRKDMEKQYDRDVIDALPEDLDRPLAQAKALYQKVIDEYGDVQGPNGLLKEQAGNILYAFDHLTVGNKAPQIEGPTIDGKTMKLSAYRGKVVVLDFWGDW
jgi:hypothetical protein